MELCQRAHYCGCTYDHTSLCSYKQSKLFALQSNGGFANWYGFGYQLDGHTIDLEPGKQLIFPRESWPVNRQGHTSFGVSNNLHRVFLSPLNNQRIYVSDILEARQDLTWTPRVGTD
jgi:hypothetical protein